jgi:REP element-mobilizing transposase RayT
MEDIMARSMRIQYRGAAYHVMARGSHGQAIFADDLDRRRFLETLGEACQRTGWRVHAYVLMGHHYHLLLETPEPNLVAGMKGLQGAYTQRYNSRHRLFGHLFQGRYNLDPAHLEGRNMQTSSVESSFLCLTDEASIPNVPLGIDGNDVFAPKYQNRL